MLDASVKGKRFGTNEAPLGGQTVHTNVTISSNVWCFFIHVSSLVHACLTTSTLNEFLNLQTIDACVEGQGFSTCESPLGGQVHTEVTISTCQFVTTCQFIGSCMCRQLSHKGEILWHWRCPTWWRDISTIGNYIDMLIF